MPSLEDRGELRRLLAGLRGPALWRQLEAIAEHPALRAGVRAQFPHLSQAAGLDRRGFLRFAAATLGSAGLAACSGPPPERIVAQKRLPEFGAPSAPRFYASVLAEDGFASGVLVETHGGRPTKIEGNPRHPASLGASSPRQQATILDLWDPDRSALILRHRQPSDWNALLAAFADLRREGGEGLRLLTPPLASPSLRAQIETVLQTLPGARWHRHEAADTAAAEQAARAVFGASLRPVHALCAARVILALDDDLLAAGPGHLRHARDFAAGREPPRMNRLYVAEPSPTPTGSLADHRLPLEGSRIASLLTALARALGLEVESPGALEAREQAWIDVVAADLRRAGPAALVSAGPGQPAAVHALAYRLNERLGATGRTTHWVASAAQGEPIEPLLAELSRGEVKTLLMLDVNPAHSLPPSRNFAALLARVPRSIHCGLYVDETAQLSAWHVPLAHALESWSDGVAWDGTAAIAQQTILPLHGAHSAHELLGALLGDPAPQGYEIVRDYWRRRLGREDFEAAWRQALLDGVIEEASLPLPPGERSESPKGRCRGGGALHEAINPAPRNKTLIPSPSPGNRREKIGAPFDGLELEIRPDPHLGDGRQANNAWLQELPKPVALTSWGNAAWISPALARERGIVDGELLRLRSNEWTLELPALILPGQAAQSVTVHLGHGHRLGRIAEGVGRNVAALRSEPGAWRVAGLQLDKTGRREALTRVQTHERMEGREPVRHYELRELLAQGDALIEDATPAHSFYDANPPHEPAPGTPAWGMTVDLNACTGCMSCTIACQAENNIPTVGADQVRRGRAMHWLRVDRYFEGPDEAPRLLTQPVPCMHCEHAPCELVCPVGATVHDAEGLNLQVYNRCIGTRFCGNNCPYSVRRFNFFHYVESELESLAAGRNPDVTVRSRGVMEKCTFCVQRISAARIHAELEDRPIAEGEVVTACQGACPTQAIRFGNLKNPDSAVARDRQAPRHYALLAELNTRPRTSYLARIRNRNPAIEEPEA